MNTVKDIITKWVDINDATPYFKAFISQMMQYEYISNNILYYVSRLAAETNFGKDVNYNVSKTHNILSFKDYKGDVKVYQNMDFCINDLIVYFDTNIANYTITESHAKVLSHYRHYISENCLLIHSSEIHLHDILSELDSKSTKIDKEYYENKIDELNKIINEKTQELEEVLDKIKANEDEFETIRELQDNLRKFLLLEDIGI